MKKSLGFTLLELLCVIAIVGILTTVAIPSFSQQIKRNRLVANANQLQSVFKFARSEAAKRNKVVQLNEDHGNWKVELAGQQAPLQIFSPTYSSISVTNLADLSINNSGEIVIAGANNKYLITDGDTSTTDYCLKVLVSGQSFLTETNVC